MSVSRGWGHWGGRDRNGEGERERKRETGRKEKRGAGREKGIWADEEEGANKIEVTICITNHTTIFVVSHSLEASHKSSTH